MGDVCALFITAATIGKTKADGDVCSNNNNCKNWNFTPSDGSFSMCLVDASDTTGVPDSPGRCTPVNAGTIIASGPVEMPAGFTDTAQVTCTQPKTMEDSGKVFSSAAQCSLVSTTSALLNAAVAPGSSGSGCATHSGCNFKLDQKTTDANGVDYCATFAGDLGDLVPMCIEVNAMQVSSETYTSDQLPDGGGAARTFSCEGPGAFTDTNYDTYQMNCKI